MWNRIRWAYYTIKSKVRWRFIRFVKEEQYYKKEHRYASLVVHTNCFTSEWLYEKIEEGRPFMAGRFGLSELFTMKAFECDISDKKRKALDQLCLWSGFFPNQERMGERFLRQMTQACYDVDFLAVGYQAMEDYFIKEYMSKNTILAEFRCLEPWYDGQPWTRALKGKKVLVIHPFAETINKQMLCRDRIFPGTEILPDCKVMTLKAVQTVAGQVDDRFTTWFDALDYMYNEAMNFDFDIALIGCGAYGFPLAAKIKEAGKQAVHMGGMLQVLFGIKGKRWDDDPIVSKFYNDYWVRPSENEKPQKSSMVENGCYW